MKMRYTTNAIKGPKITNSIKKFLSIPYVSHSNYREFIIKRYLHALEELEIELFN